jgi:hypothetical protein
VTITLYNKVIEILLVEEITIDELFHELSSQDNDLESPVEERLIPSYKDKVEIQLEGAY